MNVNKMFIINKKIIFTSLYKLMNFFEFFYCKKYLKVF